MFGVPRDALLIGDSLVIGLICGVYMTLGVQWFRRSARRAANSAPEDPGLCPGPITVDEKAASSYRPAEIVEAPAEYSETATEPTMCRPPTDHTVNAFDDAIRERSARWAAARGAPEQAARTAESVARTVLTDVEQIYWDVRRQRGRRRYPEEA